MNSTAPGMGSFLPVPCSGRVDSVALAAEHRALRHRLRREPRGPSEAAGRPAARLREAAGGDDEDEPTARPSVRNPPIAVEVRTAIGRPTRARRGSSPSPGEYEPFSFLLPPARGAFEMCSIAGRRARGPGGATIPAERRDRSASVEGFHGGGRDILMPLGRPWSMAAHRPSSSGARSGFRDDAPPGSYRGEVTVTSAGGPIGAIRILLDVLPIRLDDPPFGARAELLQARRTGREVLEAHLGTCASTA